MRSPTHQQGGASLVELLIVMALTGVALTIAVSTSVPLIAREAARGVSYDVQSLLRMARIEAISRNRPCRFTLDTAGARIEIFDSMGTSTPSDDDLLRRRSIAEAAGFAHPGGQPPITLSTLDGVSFHALFLPDGTVSTGAGEVHVFGGGQFRRVALFAAGGVRASRWNGSAWTAGT